jgi:protoporphyrinogen/coproporphyrinogen III oxidase
VNVVIVGGGITGLSAALELAGKANLTLLEQSNRLGGKLCTAKLETPLGTAIVDGGAESFITRKPEAYNLVQELGLEVLESAETKGVFLWRDQEILQVPTSPLTFLTSKLLSSKGKLRTLQEPWTRGAVSQTDESLDSFLTRRIGQEAATVFGTVMAGIYNTNPKEMSLQASFGVLQQLEQEHGSLLRGMLKCKPKRKKQPSAVSLQSGMQALVNALETKLRVLGADIRTNTRIAKVESNKVILESGEVLFADAIILACPAPSAAQLLGGEVSLALNALRHSGLGTVALAYPAFALEPLRAYRGIMIPKSENRTISAVLFTSHKMPSRVPKGVGLVRVFFDPHQLPQSEPALLEIIRAELREILQLEAVPLANQVFRWSDFPVLEVGHLERVAKAEALLPEGVYLAGASYRGLGVPDCIRQGREAAQQILQRSL